MNPVPAPTARILVTGGTFDKHYDAIKGELTFTESHLPAILEQARVTIPVAIEVVQLIDSLQMTDEHRTTILAACRAAPSLPSSWSMAPTRWCARRRSWARRGSPRPSSSRAR